MVRVNIESFSDKDRLLSPEIFAITKWEPLVERIGMSDLTPKRRKGRVEKTISKKCRRRTILSSPSSSFMEIGLPITERLKGVGSLFQLPSDSPQEETQVIESLVDIESMSPQAEVMLRPELPITAGSTGELPLDEQSFDVVERTLIEEGSVPLVQKESHTDPDVLDVGPSGVENAGLEVSASAAIISHCCQSLGAGVEIGGSTPSGWTTPSHRSALLLSPEHPSTLVPSPRIPLRVAAQKARYITTDKMGEFLNICLLQRDMKIELLEEKMQELECIHIDPNVFGEVRNQATTAAAQIKSLQNRISSIESELQKANDALKISQEHASNLRSDNGKLGAELMGQLKPEEVRPALNARFLDGILLCRLIAAKLDPTFPIGIFDPRNLGVCSRSDLKKFSEAGESSTQPSSNPSHQLQFLSMLYL